MTPEREKSLALNLTVAALPVAAKDFDPNLLVPEDGYHGIVITIGDHPRFTMWGLIGWDEKHERWILSDDKGHLILEMSGRIACCREIYRIIRAHMFGDLPIHPSLQARIPELQERTKKMVAEAFGS